MGLGEVDGADGVIVRSSVVRPVLHEIQNPKSDTAI
jgi:hypothetical protein